MQYLIAFLKRHTFFFLFLLLEGIALIWVVQHHNYQRSVVNQYTNQLTGSVYMLFNNASEYFKLVTINEELQQENAALRNILKSSVIINDTSTAKKQDTLSFMSMDSSYRQYYVYEPVKIIHNSIHKANNYIMINKGQKHGIEQDMGLMGADGIMGIVVSTSPHFSWAMSMLHSNVRISAMLKKNNQMGTVSWEGNDFKTGTLSDIPTHINVASGDTIITSGFSNIFPEGLLIGKVTQASVDKKQNNYDITFRFAEDFNALQYGYVIKNLYRKEQQNLIEESKITK
ncbi:MAG: rod shape-determining protein MreC [Bacteroidales bacterium]|nr:rod shape-determining protein MreC [Bacteroidales bacterium]MCF8332908.1 rod shape-determining protein MreC [Bacteroidales bacterium]